jgi:hypothetical protein
MNDDLVQRLREMGEHPCRADFPIGADLREAADRIEALEEALAQQVEACFCLDCEMCSRHEQLLKGTGQ